MRHFSAHKFTYFTCPSGLKRIDRKKLANLTSKVNQVVGHIRTNSISETNNLFYAASAYIAKKMGLKPVSSRTEKD